MADQSYMDKLTALCKRRGFIFQSSEIYGGIGGFWDYGPLGVELKRNIKDAWWHDMVTTRDDVVGIDCAIIMNPKVWEASGHVTGFTDPLVDCKNCKARFRADQLAVYRAHAVDRIPDVFSPAERGQVEANSSVETELVAEGGTPDEVLQTIVRRALTSKRAKIAIVPDKGQGPPWRFVADGQKSYLLAPCPAAITADNPHHRCPNCGGGLTDPRKFNLMFETYVGAMKDSSSLAYLRPETAQGIFANFKNVLDTTRVKLPFGIAQIGKSFRNEINPRNYTFRSREFEQGEMEFFCHPCEAEKWYEYWRDARYRWYVDLGLKSDRLSLRDHEPEELAHYARGCADVEYAFPFGVSELEGIANRTDYDLTQHQNASGKDLTYFDDQTRERFIPYVVEPAAGMDRTALALLCEAYTEDQAPDEKGALKPRTVMKFHPRVAPIKAAVFPLVNRDGMPEIARAIYEQLQRRAPAFYDDKGAIGRRYRRQDEAGTPFCFTVDGQTLEDGTVTVRDRDSLRQERIDKSRVRQYLTDALGREIVEGD